VNVDWIVTAREIRYLEEFAIEVPAGVVVNRVCSRVPAGGLPDREVSGTIRHFPLLPTLLGTATRSEV
jgi:hypothetical protein